MKTVKATVNGITPLLFHQFKELYNVDEQGRKKAVQLHKMQPEDEDFFVHVMKFAYSFKEDGKVYTPSKWFLNTTYGGGRSFKIGKSKISTLKTSMLTRAMFPVGHACKLTSGGEDVFIETENPVVYDEDDMMPVYERTGPMTKLSVHNTTAVNGTAGRVKVWRPMVFPWEVEFIFDIDTNEIPERSIQECFEFAGNCVGVGSWRPEHKGPYGRFKVISWEKV